jgi:hypothetical protein
MNNLLKKRGTMFAGTQGLIQMWQSVMVINLVSLGLPGTWSYSSLEQTLTRDF